MFAGIARCAARFFTPRPRLARLCRLLHLLRLEPRAVPVVGAFAPAPVAEVGAGFDGVVTVMLDEAMGTGSLLRTGRHILTAAHVVDRNGDLRADSAVTVQFTLPGGRVRMSVAPSNVLIADAWLPPDQRYGSDIAILYLPALAPIEADRYDLYRRFDEVGQVFTMVGFGLDGVGATGANWSDRSVVKRVGSNRFDADYLPTDPYFRASFPPGLGLGADFDNGDPRHDAFGVNYRLHDLGLGRNETGISPGDSGGPAFLTVNGSFTIAGVSATYRTGGAADFDGAAQSNLSFGDFFGYTRVSAFADAIDAATLGPYDLVLDLRSQLVGLDDQADRVRIEQVGDTIRILVNGRIYLDESRGNLKSVTVIASAAGGSVTRSSSLDPTLPIVEHGFVGPLHRIDSADHVVQVPNVALVGSAPLHADRLVVVGSGVGVAPSVKVYDADGRLIYDLRPFPASFVGGVRTAAGDVNGDRVADIIAAAGPGSAPWVVIFDGATGTELRRFLAYEESFGGGVNLAAADFTGDGRADLVTSADGGGGPRVRIFDGASGHVVDDFLGIEDPNFRGGARVGVGDLNADGMPDLLVGAGFGGGPRVAAFDGRSFGGGRSPRKLFPDLFVFEPSLRNGVVLSVGDVNGDGWADLIAGGGPGGGPRVYALSGRELVQAGRGVQAANFFAGDPSNRGGVRIVAKDFDGDGRAELVVGPGETGGSRVTVYDGRRTQTDGPFGELRSIDAFGGFAGVFVG